MVATNRILAVLDDDDDKREALVERVIDAGVGWRAVPVNGALQALEELGPRIEELGASAVLCDFHLLKGYAPFDGAMAASELYRRQVPAVLVTRMADAHRKILPHRRHLPTVCDWNPFSVEEVLAGVRACEIEFDGEWTPRRRPWRTLLHVEDTVPDDPESQIIVRMPSWEEETLFELPAAIFKHNPRLLETLQRGDVFWAQVNQGAKAKEDLYFAEPRAASS